MSRRITTTRGNDQNKKDQCDQYNWLTDQYSTVVCNFLVANQLKVHTILHDLSAARTAPVSICRHIYGAETQQRLYEDQWPNFSYFVGLWNGPSCQTNTVVKKNQEFHSASQRI